jgi:DNA polymerase-1
LSVVKASAPLLVLDGDFLAHRAYHALPKTIRRSGGRSGGAIVGFANALMALHGREQPRAVVVGWDTLEVPTYRHEQFPDYQSGREFDAAIVEQLRDLPELVAALGLVNAKAPGYEADDFVATAVAREERRGGRALVASGDRDMFQLASPQTTILQPVRGGEWARIGPEEVRARYGVEPEQTPDFIALRGDPSDKIPGAKGIGAVTAASLLRKYGSLDDLLAAGRFREQAAALKLFKSIATMDRKAPLPAIRNRTPAWANAALLARDWGLNALADRLAALA